MQLKKPCHQLGSAVYPTVASCLNHSCDPATLRLCRGNLVTLIARRRIQVITVMTSQH